MTAGTCGTVLRYGDVIMQNCEVTAFVQTLEYDESQTDKLFDRFRISVKCYVHDQDRSFFGVSKYPDTETPPADLPPATDQLLAFQQYMLQPRRDLVFADEGATLLLVTQDASRKLPALDVNNGPKPIECKITHFAGYKSFLVEYTIETAIVLCDPELALLGSQYNGFENQFVLNNKWSIEESRDADWFMRRTISGRLRTVHISAFPGLFRYLVMPPLVRTYKRESMRFVVSRDGLNLDYEIADKQRHAAPPSPAIEWDCKHVETTGTGGAMGYGNVSVKLTGAIGTPKIFLFNACAEVIRDRLGDLAKQFLTNVNADNLIIPQNMTIIDDLPHNVAEMRLDYRRVPDPERYINAIFKKMGQPLAIAGYDQYKWPNPIPYDGASPAGMFATYLQNPCIPVHGFPQQPLTKPTENQLPDPDDDDNESTVLVYQGEDQGEDLDTKKDQDQGLSQDQKSGDFPYTFIQLESRYLTDHGIAHMPRTNVGEQAPTFSTAISYKMHYPRARHIIYMQAERVDEWPELPAPDSMVDENGIVETLAHEDILPLPPKLMPDGKRLLKRVQAEFVYTLSRNPTASEKLRVGSLPWDATTPDLNEYIPDENQDGDGGII